MCKIHNYIETDYASKVCINCGIEKQIGLTPTKGFVLIEPLQGGYSRTKRFISMFRALVYPETAKGSSELEYYLSSKHITTVSQLYEEIRHCSCKQKNYSAIHLYALKFIPNFKKLTEPPQGVIHNIEFMFSQIESFFTLCYPSNRFFSYRYLLRQLLVSYGLHHYLVFVKKLRNKTAMKRYDKMLEIILNQMNGCSQLPLLK